MSIRSTTLFSVLWLAGALAVHAGEPLVPDAWNGVSLHADPAAPTPGGQPSVRLEASHSASDLKWPPFIVYPQPGEAISPGAKVTLRCAAKASRAQRMDWRVSRNAPASDHYSKTVTFKLTPEWQEIVFTETLYDLHPATVVNLPRMLFPDMRNTDRVWLGPLTAEVVHRPAGAAAPAPAADAAPVEIKVEQPGDWKPLSTRNLYVKPGSALDFSGFVERPPAGTWGRLVADPETGSAVFEKRPGVPVRFFSVQLMPSDLPSWSRDDIDNYAAAVARQGYNLVRFHFLDQTLQQTTRAPALKQRENRYTLPTRPEDIVFHEPTLDRFHYLVAALKKNGIYLNMDAMTTYVGYDGGQTSVGSNKGPYTTKVQMFVNPMFRENWKAGVTRLFGDVNPHTGLALKDDPAVVLVSCLNEQEILTAFRDYSVELKPAWVAFLKRKYPDYAALHKAWGGKCGDETLPEPGKGAFAEVPGIVHKTAAGNSRAGMDMTECIGELEAGMTDFYLAALREIGYPGLVTNWNMRTRMVSVPARAKLSAVSMNGYHSHPQNGYSTKGTTVDPAGSVKRAGNSFKHQALARFADRPFFNTEFGFCFWNPLRHEQGLVFGSGAALQGWASITCHAGQVRDGGTRLVPFGAGADPVIRAAEAVEALAYLRGDVRTSPHLAAIPLDDRYIFGGRALRGLSDELSRLWALCRVGILYGAPKVAVKPDLTVFPGQTTELGGTDMFTSVENTVSSAAIAPVVDKLRERGVLPAGNLTDPARGIYQSDTGEITLDIAGEGVLTVVTPRLAGVTVKSDREYRAGALTVRNCTAPAAVTVASLDAAAPIPRSRRLLVVFATDALNNGMRFQDPERKTLETLGTLPVLWRTGRLSLDIAVDADAGGTAKVYALALDGTRVGELPSTHADGKLRLDIDTAKLPTEPSVFFEVVRE